MLVRLVEVHHTPKRSHVVSENKLNLLSESDISLEKQNSGHLICAKGYCVILFVLSHFHSAYSYIKGHESLKTKVTYFNFFHESVFQREGSP